MAKIFLKCYVGLVILLLVLSLFISLAEKETVRPLEGFDWLAFIIACGFLGLVEVLEKQRKE